MDTKNWEYARFIDSEWLNANKYVSLYLYAETNHDTGSYAEYFIFGNERGHFVKVEEPEQVKLYMEKILPEICEEIMGWLEDDDSSIVIAQKGNEEIYEKMNNVIANLHLKNQK